MTCVSECDGESKGDVCEVSVMGRVTVTCVSGGDMCEVNVMGRVRVTCVR